MGKPQTNVAIENRGLADRVEQIRADFPILHQEVNSRPLVYLDNAATSQKPRSVIDAVSDFYLHDNANVHRGVHALSMRATQRYEGARERVRQFINAASTKEVIFLRGATEAINLVANTFGRQRIEAGHEVLITELEHHANIVPWKMLCDEVGAELKVVPINDDGSLNQGEYARLLNRNTRIVCLSHVSNALGTVNPVKAMIAQAHALDVPVLLDGAQATPHERIDVQDMDADFYVFSGHKMYAPSGIGVLYGKLDLLQDMPPWQGGGDMILTVDFDKIVYAGLPAKFEAGTPDFGGAIGLAAAIDYIEGIGIEAIADYEHQLIAYCMGQLGEIPGVRLIGTAPGKAAAQSFVIDGAHPHDVGTIMDQQGVAIRAGHHCAMPVMKHYCVPATARASFAFYNTFAEVDALVEAIYKVKELFDR